MSESCTDRAVQIRRVHGCRHLPKLAALKPGYHADVLGRSGATRPQALERLVAGSDGARLVSIWLAGSGSGKESWTMSAPTAAITPAHPAACVSGAPIGFTARGMSSWDR